MALVLGIDGGGTKTDLALATSAGRIIARARAGATSLARRPAEEVEHELLQGLQQLGGDVAAVCGGFASAGAHTPAYEEMLRRLLPRARLRIVTDAEVAWRGAFGGKDGVVVIAGTGSIAWGRLRGRLARAGGETPGRDPGSGDWLRATGASDEDAGQALGGLVRQCAQRLGWASPVASWSGGVLAHRPGVLIALQEAFLCEWRTPLASPVEGAVQMAVEC